MLMLARTYTVFFFNDTATTEIYTLSLHDALPISHELKPSNAAMMMLQRRIAFTLASASVASDAPGSGVTPTRGRRRRRRFRRAFLVVVFLVLLLLLLVLLEGPPGRRRSHADARGRRRADARDRRRRQALP